MTVGEKIQYYRKKSGISQEELGQKMLVSRQTISLWEMDKTLPTIDNLMRLRELFSITIDDFLSVNEPVEENVKNSKESYVFKLDKIDLQKIFKKTTLLMVKRAIFFVLACFTFFILTIATNAPSVITGAVVGWFLLGSSFHIIKFCDFRKKMEKK